MLREQDVMQGDVDTENHSGLISQVFQPGNLVWGSRYLYGGDWKTLLTEGIKPSSVVNRAPHHAQENWMCTALMPDWSFPRRYRETDHLGPKDEERYTPFQLSVVISRDRLLRAFPGQVFAIGEAFWDKGFEPNRDHFGYDPKTKSAFGIPIKNPRGEPSWPLEVRVYPREVEEARISMSEWIGLVVKRTHLSTANQMTEEVGELVQLPVFSTDGKLIATSLGSK